MPGEKILVVDDEKEIRELIVKYLKREGMTVYQAECGQKAIKMVETDDFDLIVLDIMMNDMDGFDVLLEIRKNRPCLPVVLLSARQEDYDKVLGFGLGADDYVTKPFSPAELTARIKSHIKRSIAYRESAQVMDEIVRGSLCIDLKSYSLTKNNVPIELSVVEFKLLSFFMKNPGIVFTKKQIYNNVWEQYFTDDNSVMVYISHLRDKIEDNPKEPKFIQTVRGIGYKFVV
ncbi:MAG: response regulator transcription factor [Clostridiaceae bacterium]|nr:response regulator transcription factor [Clostridiaceae bacterium]